MPESQINELKCKKCQRKLAENLTGHIEIVCPRCGELNKYDVTIDKDKDLVYVLSQ